MRHARQMGFGRARGQHGRKHEREVRGDALRLGIVLRSNRFDPLPIVRIQQRKRDDRPDCAVMFMAHLRQISPSGNRYLVRESGLIVML